VLLLLVGEAMTEYAHSFGVLDVVSMLNRRDTAYVLPTLAHALEWWRVVRTAVNEEHGKDCVTNTKTACVLRCNHRALRLWVPYELDPTQPMDFDNAFKSNCDFVSPYFYPNELKAMA
jgi:hypothetical protein